MNEISDAMRAPSRMGTVLGIATIIFGILAMMMPMISGITVAAIVAVLLIAGGIARTIFAFKAGSLGRGLLMFLFGGLSILCGIVMLARPLLGLASITFVLVVYFIVDGIFEIIAGFKLKGVKGWFWFVIVAFKTHVVWGVAVLIFNLAALAFLVINWAETKVPFAIAVLGVFISAAGLYVGLR